MHLDRKIKMHEEGIQKQSQITVSVDHPVKDETQHFFCTGVRIVIAAACVACLVVPDPNRVHAVRSAGVTRGSSPT